MDKQNNRVKGKRKVRVFLVFLLGATLAWFTGKLSENYIGRTQLDLRFTQTPDSLLLMDASRNAEDIRIEATGFRFLGFNFGRGAAALSLKNVHYDGGRYFLPPKAVQRQLEKSLSDDGILLDTDSDTLFFEMQPVVTKELPIKALLDMELPKNHMLDGGLQIHPAQITVTGPKSEIDTMTHIPTEVFHLGNLSSGFEQQMRLVVPGALKYTRLSGQEVVVSGKVVRFSEKELALPVTVKNAPEGFNIQTFPKTVSVRCKAKMDRLKTLTSDDFGVVADYNALTDGTNNPTLTLSLEKQPSDVYSAKLLQTKVQFIMKRL